MAGIDEKLLAELGEEGLGNHRDVPKLARELGFKQTKINSYIQTNFVCGQVGTKGTVNLLFDWKKGTRKAQQIPKLKAALRRAGFDDLVDEYFPDHSTNTASNSAPEASSSATVNSAPVSTETTSTPLPDTASTSSVIPKTEPAIKQEEHPVGNSPVAQPSLEQPTQPVRNRRNQSSQSQSPASARMAGNNRVTGRQISFLSKNILPTCYNDFCAHLGIGFAIYDGVRLKHMNNYPAALVEIINTWSADRGGLLWDLDQALIASGSARLVDIYKDPPQQL